MAARAPGPQATVEQSRGAEQGERDEPADEVIAGRRPRIRLQEAVVDDVQRDGADREPRERDLAAERRRDAGGNARGWCR